MEKAKHLKLAITAGIGSDHVDLHAAAEHGLTVAEATGSNNVSTAEQAVLCILRYFHICRPTLECVSSCTHNRPPSPSGQQPLTVMQAARCLLKDSDIIKTWHAAS